MNKKLKKVASILAAGLIVTGAVGMVSACGSKQDQTKDDEKQEITQPVDPEPENVNEVEEFLTMAKNVTNVINSIGANADANASSVSTLNAANFRIMPMAMAGNLNQTLLADLGAVADTAALTEDTANVKRSMQGDTMMVSLGQGFAYLVNQRNGTKLYGKVLASLESDRQYFRVTKVGKVWTIEEFGERKEADGSITPTNYYRFEIEYQDANHFKMQYYFKGYGFNDEMKWSDELSYAYVDSEQNFFKIYNLEKLYQYGSQKNGAFVGWKITDDKVIKDCQNKVAAEFPTVEVKDLSKLTVDYSFTDKEVGEAFTAIMGGN